jgi:hypothetical protein
MGYIFSGDSCQLNPQKFWIFNIHGPHEIYITHICKFMHSDTDFVVEGECKKCGKTFMRHFVDYNELLHVGFTPSILKKVDTWGYWYNEEFPDVYRNAVKEHKSETA